MYRITTTGVLPYQRVSSLCSSPPIAVALYHVSDAASLGKLKGDMSYPARVQPRVPVNMHKPDLPSPSSTTFA